MQSQIKCTLVVKECNVLPKKKLGNFSFIKKKKEITYWILNLKATLDWNSDFLLGFLDDSFLKYLYSCLFERRIYNYIFPKFTEP